MSNQSGIRWGVRCVLPLDEPRDTEKERQFRVDTIAMCIEMANQHGLATGSEVEVADDRYGRYVETYPPGDASHYVPVAPSGMVVGDADEVQQVLVPPQDPVIMFLDCREEVATHVVYLAEVEVEVGTDAPR